MAPPLPFSKLLFRPRSTPFLPAPQIPRILTSGLYRSGSGGVRRMCASESTSARATRPVPAVNGDVVVRAGAGGKFRFADVSFGGFWGFGVCWPCWLVYGGFGWGGRLWLFFVLFVYSNKRVSLSLPLYNALPPMSSFPPRLPLQPAPPFPKPPPPPNHHSKKAPN